MNRFIKLSNHSFMSLNFTTLLANESPIFFTAVGISNLLFPGKLLVIWSYLCNHFLNKYQHVAFEMSQCIKLCFTNN